MKSYEPVPSNASLSVNDSSEIILKYKNKYYNNDFPKEQYGYKKEYEEDYLTIYDMRKKMKKYVKKYKEEGAYVYYD